MGSKWQKKTWGDLATLEYGKGLRGYQEAADTFRVFGTNGPIGWHDEPLCQFPSVIIGRKGAYRGIHFSPAPFFVIDTAFYLNPKDDFNIKWAYYELLTHDINSMDSGSAIPSTSRESFYQLPVSVPPKDEQRAIAHILGSLDDKIALNRRMNDTLEAMARAIFKSWFVDFDPVSAKAEGRDPGLPKEISDLFPDNFEDSELGQIPKGWKVGSVSGLANVTSGKRPQKRSKEETGEFTIPLYGGGGVMAYVSEPMISKPFLLTGRVGTLGKVFRITEDCWPSDNTLLLFPNDKSCLEFLYFILQRIDFDSLNRGSTQPLVTQTDLKNQRIVIPKESILIFYWQNVHPMFKKIDKNIAESRTLASLRDTLLLKLISGELRVPDTERFIEEAGL